MGRRALRKRGQRLLGAAAAVLLLATAASASVLAYATSMVRERATNALQARLGTDVVIGDIDVGLSAVSLADIEIDGLGKVGRVVATYELSSLLTGDVEIGRVDVYRVEFEIVRDASGALSTDDMVRQFGSAKNAGGGGGGADRKSISLYAVPIELHDVRIVARDEKTDRTVTIAADRLIPNRSSRALEVSGGSFVGQYNGWGRHDTRLAKLLLGKRPADVAGSVALADGKIDVQLRGSLAHVPESRWELSGEIAPQARTASLHLATDGVSAAQFATSELSRGFLLDPEAATLNVDIELGVTPRGVVVTGTGAVAGLSFQHRRLATGPIRNIDLAARGTAEIDFATKSIAIRDGFVKSGDIDYSIELAAQLADSDRADKPEASLSARVSVPTVPCQSLLDSIPDGLVPDLVGFRLAGEMAGRVELDIDWAVLKKTHFTSTILDSKSGIDNCRVLEAPKRMSADRLRGSFEHTVPVGSNTLTYTVGPENDAYVPLSKVSRHLTRSLMTTEDSRFYRHNGFITKEFRGALIKNLERGRFAYGASSISMQVVKNVMLARTKTVSRKLEELFLTWYIERELGKDRILEIYVNAIEFGPGIYGIKPAAKRYFKKHPRQLNPVESAFFSSILPAPVRRFKQYCRGWAGSWTKGKIERILDLMFERNRLDVDAYLKAIDTSLVFRGSRREICRRYQDGLIGAVSTVDSDAKGKSL